MSTNCLDDLYLLSSAQSPVQLAVYVQDDEAQDSRLLCKVGDIARSTRVKIIIRLLGPLLFSRILTEDGTAGWCGPWAAGSDERNNYDYAKSRLEIYWWIHRWTCISKFPRLITCWTVCFVFNIVTCRANHFNIHVYFVVQPGDEFVTEIIVSCSNLTFYCAVCLI